MFIFLLIILLQIVRSDIKLETTYYIKDSLGLAANASTWNANYKNMMSIIQKSNGKQHLMLELDETSPTFKLMQKRSSIPNAQNFSYKYHSFYGNKINTTNPKYLLFNTTACLLMQGFNYTNLLTIYMASLPTQQIVDCGFGIQNNINYVLVNDTSNSSYLMLYIQNFVINHTINIGSLGIYRKFVLTGGYLYLSFQTGVYVYSSNAPLSLIKVYNYTVTTNKTFCMQAKYDMLAYSVGTKLFVYNTTSSTLAHNLSSNIDITDIELYYPDYVIYSNNNAIFLHDIEIRTLINSYTTSSITGSKMDLIGKYLFLYKQFGIQFDNLPIFLITKQYNCTGGCVSCLSTYQINSTNTKCQKVSKNISIPQIVPTNDNIITTPISNTTTDITNNSNDSAIYRYSVIMGHMLKAASLQPIWKIFFSFIVLLDDIYYYQFHRVNYTQSINTLIKIVNTINQVRLAPWFLQIFFDCIIPKLGEENSKYMHLIKYNYKNPDNFYFLSSIQDIYTGYLFMYVAFFIFDKILAFIFKLIRKKNFVFLELYIFFAKNAIWWIVPVMIIESNAIRLSYSLFLQFQSPMVSFFSSQNKFNLFAALITFLIILIYSMFFYFLAFQYEKKKYAKTLLIWTKFNIGSMIVESLCRNFRSVIRGVFHALFYQNYKYQISCLMMSDAIYILGLCLLRKSFKNKFIYFFQLLFYVCFFLFDLLLLFHYLYQKYFQNIDYDLFTFVFLCLLIGASIIVMIALLVKQLYKILKSVKTKIMECLKKCNQTQEKAIILKQNKNKQLFKFKPSMSKNRQVILINVSKIAQKQKSILRKQNKKSASIIKKTIVKTVKKQVKKVRSNQNSMIIKSRINQQSNIQLGYSGTPIIKKV